MSSETIPNLFCAIGSETTSLSKDDLKQYLFQFAQEVVGDRDDVLLVPPDCTRLHSRAGEIVQILHEKLPENVSILPALGTHAPMSDDEIRKMYGDELADKKPSPFIVHDWRNDVVTIGEVPADLVSKATNGRVNKPWPAQLNRIVWGKRRSLHQDKPKPPLVLSIGQVVPHEVMGMANYNKNLFVGTGGSEVSLLLLCRSSSVVRNVSLLNALLCRTKYLIGH